MRQKGFAPIIILIVILVAMVGVAFYLTKTGVAPTPISDITANWKTYTNNTYGYSIKVPDYITQIIKDPSYQTKINDADWYFVKKDLGLVNSPNIKFTKSAIVLEITTYKEAAQRNYKTFCTGQLLTSNQESPNITHDSPITGVEQYVASSGVASHPALLGGKYWTNKTCFIKNEIVYVIDYVNYEGTSRDTTFYQILSTFKFTNLNTQESTPTIAFLPPLSNTDRKSDRDAITTKVINPFIDFQRDIDPAQIIASITIEDNTEASSKDRFPFKFTAIFKNGSKTQLLLGQTNGVLDWYLPTCMGCKLTPEFIQKYPEIDKIFQ